MNKTTKYLILSVVFMFLFSIIHYTNTFTHEKAHMEIASKFGCINGEITFNPIKSSYFTCYEYSNRSEEYVIEERKLHMQNDILSYNLQTLYTILLLCILTIIIVFQINNQRI